jgi:hypothetical protein
MSDTAKPTLNDPDALFRFVDDHPFHGLETRRIKSGPFYFFHHNGTVYVTGLFKAMDQDGIPLAVSLMLCQKHGYVACLDQFVLDAASAGWGCEKTDGWDQKKARAQKRVEEACADTGYFNPANPA